MSKPLTPYSTESNDYFAAKYIARATVLYQQKMKQLASEEELLSTSEYQRTIKANDRATMLNLMIGLNGYTLCSGIICEELNGSDYIAVPFDDDSDEIMEIGYITLKNVILSEMAEIYIKEIKAYLNI